MLRLGAMLSFLKSMGLDDIRFIIINSKQTGSDFRSLDDLVSENGISIYQETADEPIWEKLQGGKDDMFVYDRCGRLTYYVPYPLSVIHANQPIIHTTLLSTYFDNPCGECKEKKLHVEINEQLNTTYNLAKDIRNVSEIEENVTTTIDLVTSSLEETSTVKVFQHDNKSELINITKELTEDGLLIGPTQTEKVNFESEESGSGMIESSGDGELESGTEINYPGSTETSVTTTRHPFDTFALSGPWKIFSFFLGEKILEKPPQVNATLPEKPVQNLVNISSTTINPIHHPKLCNGFDKSICVEFSTDKLLRARLCCLKEDINKDQGFGCNRYTKPKCNKMLPLIKCCLKDFAQLLESYFRNNSPNHSQ